MQANKCNAEDAGGMGNFRRGGLGTDGLRYHFTVLVVKVGIRWPNLRRPYVELNVTFSTEREDAKAYFVPERNKEESCRKDTMHLQGEWGIASVNSKYVGRARHAIGYTVFSQTQLEVAAYQWLLFNPVTDSRSIGYLVDRTDTRCTIDRFSRNRQEEENTITFRLKCIVIA